MSDNIYSQFRTRKLSDQDVSDIRRKYEAGQTGPELAAEYQVHVSAIYYRLHQRVIVRDSGATRTKNKQALEARLSAVQAVVDSWDDSARERLVAALSGAA